MICLYTNGMILKPYVVYMGYQQVVYAVFFPPFPLLVKSQEKSNWIRNSGYYM